MDAVTVAIGDHHFVTDHAFQVAAPRAALVDVAPRLRGQRDRSSKIRPSARFGVPQWDGSTVPFVMLAHHISLDSAPREAHRFGGGPVAVRSSRRASLKQRARCVFLSRCGRAIRPRPFVCG